MNFYLFPNLSTNDIKICFEIGESIGELNKFRKNNLLIFSKNVSNEIFFKNLLNINENEDEYNFNNNMKKKL